MNEPCKHDTQRYAQTTIEGVDSMRRMEWCESCGALLDDRSWKIPYPVYESDGEQKPKQEGEE